MNTAATKLRMRAIGQDHYSIQFPNGASASVYKIDANHWAESGSGRPCWTMKAAVLAAYFRVGCDEIAPIKIDAAELARLADAAEGSTKEAAAIYRKLLKQRTDLVGDRRTRHRGALDPRVRAKEPPRRRRGLDGG